MLRRGAFEDGILELAAALRSYERDRNINEQCGVLIGLSQAYEGIGEYGKSLQRLEKARVLAEEMGDKTRTASILGRMGNVSIVLGPEEQAYRYLNEGLSMAEQLADTDIQSTILNNVGNLLASQRRYDEAASVYEESAHIAAANGNHAVAAVAFTNEASALAHVERYEESRDILDKALSETDPLVSSHEKAYALISIALAYQGLGTHIAGVQKALSDLATREFIKAVGVCEALDDSLGLSYALGYLGRLREDEGQLEEALQLTQRALAAALRCRAPESIYRWRWQKGRLLKAAGQLDDAISVYRSAISSLESIRQEMSNCYGRPRSSFREPAGPIYLEYVDLLLQRAAASPEHKADEAFLLEARETLESLKVCELRDYYRDDCVDAARSAVTRLDEVSRSAVIIYPILLKDRIELLVSLPCGMKRYSMQVGAEAMTREVRGFRTRLEKLTTREYLPHAQRLYNWLIRPIEEDLRAASIDTLVFVPDGPLGTIPMAALHDGKEFLIQKYAVAITPGLDITDPRPVERKNMNILVLGLTDSVQGYPPLPFVSDELAAISELCKSKQLVNESFVLSKVEKSLQDERFSMVHIASHGQFEGDVDKTFLLTFDDKLTMDRLNRYVGLFKFRDTPLDLLTLSACDTAAGDDRAALGLAGIAIKAGARSAVGTLWHINDQSSLILVKEFYRQLTNQSVSRAVALQRAQLRMLKDRRYQHPRYWSPFLLINNWL